MIGKFQISYFYVLLLILDEVSQYLFRYSAISELFVFYSIIAISFFYFAKSIVSYNNQHKFLKAWIWFVVIVLIYGGYLILTGHTFVIKSSGYFISSQSYLKYTLYSILPVFPLYHFYSNDKLNKSNLKVICILFLLASIIHFLMNYQNLMVSMMLDTDDYNTNNMGYLFLQILPLILIAFDKQIVKFGLLFFCLYMMVLGMKRGAFILGALSIITIFIYYFKEYKLNSKFKVLIPVIAGLGIIYTQWTSLVSSSDFFNSRIEQTLEGGTSSRDRIYEEAWTVFTNSDLFSQLFGHGANATMDLMSNVAHNDWLELLINQGLLGVFVYLLIMDRLFKIKNSFKNNNLDFYISSMVLFIVMFGRSIFSMGYSDMSFAYSLGLAVVLVETTRKSSGI